VIKGADEMVQQVRKRDGRIINFNEDMLYVGQEYTENVSEI